MQLFFLFFINVIIVAIWFHSGLITGGGDTGLPLYNPSLIASITQYAWWSAQGTGFSYPGVLSSLPLYSVLSFFQFVGFNPFALQVLFFGGILVLSSFGMFLFTRKVTDKNSLAFIVTIFYLINPFAMINIWHRGAYNSMLMLVILPWTCYLLYQTFFEQRLKYLIILSIISPFFSYAFNTPGFIATWWFVIISMWVYLFFTHAVFQKLKKIYVSYLFIFIFLWLGVNFWWLFPFFHIAPTTLFITTNEASSIASMEAVSQFFKLPYALRGISTFYPIVQNDWGPLYSNPFFDLLSFIELGFITFAFFYSKKIKMFGLFLFIFLVSVFISKGSEDPFGFIITYAFAVVPYLGVFRNPFEKFGVLIPFVQCFLAGYGLYYATRIKKKWVKIGIVLLLIGFLVYHWPFFTGNIFGNFSYPATIQVPKEYDEVRAWFEKNGSNDPRILHLPFALGDGIIYDWPHGYWGLEPSQLFFPGSSISHFVGFPLVDARYQDLSIAVRSRNKPLFQSLISKLAINYIVVHKDVDFTVYRNDSLNNINTFLNSLPFLEKKTILGNLVIYKVRNTSQNHINVEQIANPSTVNGDISYIPQILESNDDTQIFVGKATKSNINIVPSKNYLLPEEVINPFNVIINKNILMQEMPYTKFLPGSFFYPLIIMKESFEKLGKSDLDLLLLQLQDSSKRLVETNQLISLSKNNNAEQTLIEYNKELKELTPAFTTKFQSDIHDYSSLEITALAQILLRQKELLHRMSLSATPTIKPQIENASKNLDNLLYESGVISRFNIPNSSDLRIYRFSVTHAGDYQIYISKDWLPFFNNMNEATTYVDGKKYDQTIRIDSNKLSTGPFHLNTGNHDIGFQINTSNSVHNAIYSATLNNPFITPDKNNEEIDLKADKKPTYLDYSIDNFNPSYTYLVSFDSWTKYGAKPDINFVQDIDPPSKPEMYLNPYNLKEYQFYWQTGSTSHVANLFVHGMKVRITLNPWNNCIDMLKEKKSLCQNLSQYQAYNKSSEAVIKNVKLQKFPPDEIYLADNPSSKEKSIAVTSQYINPTKYTVSLNSTSNSVVILNETYHDGWQLFNDKGTRVNVPHVLVDGYANGWILKGLPPGRYTISFISQIDKSYGIIGSVICTIIGIGLIIQISKWKKVQK